MRQIYNCRPAPIGQSRGVVSPDCRNMDSGPSGKCPLRCLGQTAADALVKDAIALAVTLV